MATFQTKPVRVEARQLTDNNSDTQLNELVAWVARSGGTATHNGTDLTVWTTPEGPVVCRFGEWLVLFPCGGFAVVSDEIIANDYEKVEA